MYSITDQSRINMTRAFRRVVFGMSVLKMRPKGNLFQFFAMINNGSKIAVIDIIKVFTSLFFCFDLLIKKK